MVTLSVQCTKLSVSSKISFTCHFYMYLSHYYMMQIGGVILRSEAQQYKFMVSLSHLNVKPYGTFHCWKLVLHRQYRTKNEGKPRQSPPLKSRDLILLRKKYGMFNLENCHFE